MRQIANKVERDYGKIDIVVADAAIQRWMPLLESPDSGKADGEFGICGLRGADRSARTHWRVQ